MELKDKIKMCECFEGNQCIDEIKLTEQSCYFCTEKLVSGVLSGFDEDEFRQLRCIKCVNVMYLECIPCNTLCIYLGAECDFIRDENGIVQDYYQPNRPEDYLENTQDTIVVLPEKFQGHKYLDISFYVGHLREPFYIQRKTICRYKKIWGDTLCCLNEYSETFMYWECPKCINYYELGFV